MGRAGSCTDLCLHYTVIMIAATTATATATAAAIAQQLLQILSDLHQAQVFNARGSPTPGRFDWAAG
jgi:hypothetical protein